MRLFMNQVVGQPAIGWQTERAIEQPVHGVFQPSGGDIKAVQRDFAKLIPITQRQTLSEQLHRLAIGAPAQEWSRKRSGSSAIIRRSFFVKIGGVRRRCYCYWPRIAWHRIAATKKS